MKNTKKKILVIDDEETIQYLVKDVLAEKGYEVIAAGNGLEGIKKTIEEKPDLVIVDIMMPYLDGYHMIYKMINEEYVEKLPAFMILSVRSKTLDKNLGERIGAYTYLSKPFKSEELVQLVERAIGA